MKCILPIGIFLQCKEFQNNDSNLMVTSGPLHVLQIELIIISLNCFLPCIKRFYLVLRNTFQIFTLLPFIISLIHFFSSYPLKVWSATVEWLLYLLGSLEKENLGFVVFFPKMYFFQVSSLHRAKFMIYIRIRDSK